MCTEVRFNGRWCDTIGELRGAAGLSREQMPLDAAYKDLPPDDSCLCAVAVGTLAFSIRAESEYDDCADRWFITSRHSPTTQPTKTEQEGKGEDGE